MVTLVTIGAWTSNHILIEFLILYILVYFSGFLNERLIVYDFFVQLSFCFLVVYTILVVITINHCQQHHRLYKWVEISKLADYKHFLRLSALSMEMSSLKW